MNKDELKNKLHQYIDEAGESELENMMHFVEESGATYTKTKNWWDDEEIVADFDQRVADLESGKDKGYTWEEVQEHGRKLIDELNSKRNK